MHVWPVAMAIYATGSVTQANEIDAIGRFLHYASTWTRRYGIWPGFQIISWIDYVETILKLTFDIASFFIRPSSYIWLSANFIPHARTQASTSAPIAIEACLMFCCSDPSMNVCSSLFDLQGDPSLLVVSHSDLTGDLYESRYSGLGARMNLLGGLGGGDVAECAPLLGPVVQSWFSFTTGWPKIQSKLPNSLSVNLEIFLQRSGLDRHEFTSLKFWNKQTCRNTQTKTLTAG
jgi:hypothetical protein